MSASNVAVATGLIRRMELPIFFFAVGVIMSGAMVLLAATGDENFALIGVVLLGPSVTAVLLTALIIGRTGLRQLLVKQMTFRFGVRWYLIAFLLIPAFASIAVGLRTLFGGSDVAPDIDYSLSAVLPEIAPILIVTLIISLAEEFGWRGYALPRLQLRLNALQASLVLGALWGLWHFPGFLAGTGVPEDMPFYVFMLWVVPATVLITWVYNNTGSVVTAIGMHTAANFSFNAFPLLPQMTGTGGLATFWIFLGVLWATTIAIVIVFGPTHLSRSQPRATIGVSADKQNGTGCERLVGHDRCRVQ